MCVCVCVFPVLTFECLNQSLLNLVTISRHLSPSQRPNKNIHPISLCVCMCIPLSLLNNGSVKIPTVVRQRLSIKVTAVTNTHATIEELLDASFSMWPVSYQG
jgi:hypothetical protein